jgi:hypothetical protein
MDRSGLSAALRLIFAGRSAVDPLAEVDLDVASAAGTDSEPLIISPPAPPVGSTPLAVTAAVSWTGRTASESA